MGQGLYSGKNILITGGTGTIGRQLVERLLQEDPRVIRIFSRDEHKQFEMGIDFQEHSNKLRFLIGDVRDLQRLGRAMEDVDYVFHCAAMKHVPACEYNPFEAVQTNVIGTQNVIQASIEKKIKKVLFVSTDKAISPTNTYGATKLTAERLISATEHHKGAKSTIFSSVRFGNVMSSRGSVIPLFRKQILENRRITLTDPTMLRYMMTPSQAINLILKANGLAMGGEVFVLKMPLINVGELAEVVIENTKEKYGIQGEVLVDVIGLRSGEKRFEELMTDDEAETAYETEDMYIIPQDSKTDYFYKENYNKVLEKPYPDRNKTIQKQELSEWFLKEKMI
ncbi:polysaccharide biosynthesis protein CapD [Paenibacillus sp. FSL R5-192]|uniref:SDR family NAD(P)-dependent oxidoreductase n=1 Tax=Paenibacillus sp. FSL R5-192 TaxID=1226754 RepID=UPI0003E1E59E|nr:SDR family NAD(P)-dependent oxidoreductase [Paenibacillus sp. FSL R5-192]ETT41089.1 polysaccharide biosynthesis protein CapD [Paenibacillus sp. FSL R5-192]